MASCVHDDRLSDPYFELALLSFAMSAPDVDQSDSSECNGVSERIGSVVANRFSLEALAGTGGMGAVYRAFDRDTQAAVALKVMTSPGETNAARFNQETAMLRELEHDGIVRYVAHGECDDGSPFLAMEWLAGEDLADRLERGPLGVAETTKLGVRVATALGVAHARGIVHRDIKPSNLFLPDGDVERVKILDFGIARALDGARLTTSTGSIVGTLGYIAPEQARGMPLIDSRVDVFALGCVLFECITGEPAFAADHVLAILAKILFEEAPRLAGRGIPATDSLDALLSRMFAKDPALRPANGTELAAELLALEDVAHETAPPSAGPTSLTRAEQRLLCVVVVGRARDAQDLNEVADTLSRSAVGVPIHEALREQARALDARIERLLDGSIVATIGGGGAVTDQAARGARCALLLRSLLPNAPMALATGRGEVGGAVPIGEVIDRAAALLRETRLGETGRSVIRIDAVTAGLVDTRFDVIRKGTALDLIGERDGRAVTRTLLGKPTSCVGRERETAFLVGKLDECLEESSARVVLITGVAGVGKSRLRTEFLRALALRSARVEVWESRGDSMSAGAPFVMIAPFLKRASGITDRDSIDVRCRKLAARVERHVPSSDQQRVTEFLGEIVGTPFPAETSAPLRAARADPLVMGDQARRAFMDLIVHECAATPLLLVLEDLHWGDLPSINLIDAALRAAKTRPLMILALARPEINLNFPGLWSGRGIAQLELLQISAQASASLVREALGDQVADSTVERIVTQATGNAFYLEELIRAVAEGRDDRLPETVFAMIVARLEALEPDTRRLLRAASIFGETFSGDAVAKLLAISPHAAELSVRLAELIDKELITERSTATLSAEGEYSFRHAVVREAAYGTLTEDDRILGHRLAGEWLAEQGQLEAIVIAEHLDRGRADTSAVEWYRRAAEEALGSNDFDAAIARANRGISCGADAEVRGALHMVLCEAHAWKSDHAASLEQARLAAALFTTGSTSWFSAVGRVVLECRRLGRVDEAVSWGEKLGAAWHPQDGSGAAIVAACLAADTLCLLGRPDAGDILMDRVDEAVAKTERIEPYALGHVYRLCGLRNQFRDKDPSAMATWLARSIEAFDAVGDIRNACVQRANRGFSLLQLGDYEECERELLAAMEVASRLGLLTLVAVCEHNLGAAIAHQGRVDEAVASETSAVAAFSRQKDLRLEAAARTYLARLLLERNDHASAREEALRAVDLASSLAATRAQALATLARVYLAENKPIPAMSAASEANAILTKLGAMEGSEERIRLIYAEALDAIGDHDEARVVIADARDRVLARADRITNARWRVTYLERVRESVRTLQLAREWKV